MLKSFFHTGFVVKDIEESVRFYSEVLGMRIAGRTERQGEFVEQVLALSRRPHQGRIRGHGRGTSTGANPVPVAPERPPAESTATTSAHPTSPSTSRTSTASTRKTSKKGLTYNNPPATMYDENGSVARKACYATDPDGNWLEFVEIF